MGYYSTLVTTNFESAIELDDEGHEGREHGFRDLEQGSYLPPFWTALFEITDICSANSECIEGGSRYTFIAPKRKALELLMQRKQVLLNIFGAQHARRITLFHDFISSGKGNNVLMDPSQLIEVSDHPPSFRDELVYCLQRINGLTPEVTELLIPRVPTNLIERIFPKPPHRHVIGTDLGYTDFAAFVADPGLLTGTNTQGTPWDSL